LSTGPAAPGGETLPLRAGDSGWGTVVLPGGGHPDHAVDRTQLLALDESDEPAAAISITARLSLGAPEPVEAVDTGGLTSIRPPAGLEPFPALPAAIRGPSLDAWAIPRVGLASAPAGSAGGRGVLTPAGSPPMPATSAVAGELATAPIARPLDDRSTGSSSGPSSGPSMDGPGTVPVVAPERGSTAPPTAEPPVMPGSHPMAISGGHPVVTGPASHPAVISGAHPIVGVPPSGASPIVGVPSSGGHPVVGTTGGHPVIGRPTPRGRGPAPTNAHPGLRPVANADTRLAWGFLLGVLITVAIVSVAVALGLYFME